MKVFLVELRRGFCSRRFVIAIGLALLIVIAHIVFSVIPAAQEQRNYVELVGYPLSVYNRWIGGWPGTVFPTLYFFVIPILVCIPYSDSLYQDREAGLADQIISRSSSAVYYRAKYAVAFIVGVAVSCIPLVLDFYTTALMLPLAQPSAASGLFPIFPYSMWSDIYYVDAFRYVIQYMVLIGVASGLLACLPFLFSRFFRTRPVVLCSSFFICTILYYLFGNSDFIFLVPPIFMRPDQPQWGLTFGSILITISAMALVSFVAMIRSWRAYESL